MEGKREEGREQCRCRKSSFLLFPLPFHLFPVRRRRTPPLPASTRLRTPIDDLTAPVPAPRAGRNSNPELPAASAGEAAPCDCHPLTNGNGRRGVRRSVPPSASLPEPPPTRSPVGCRPDDHTPPPPPLHSGG